MIEIESAEGQNVSCKSQVLTVEVRAAINAFGRGERLSRTKRRSLATAFRGNMSRARAWVTVKNYAMGQTHDIGDKFLKVVHAWLVLGETQFEIIFRVAVAVRMAIEKGPAVLDAVFTQLKTLLPSFPRRRLRREIETIKMSLEFAFAA